MGKSRFSFCFIFSEALLFQCICSLSTFENLLRKFHSLPINYQFVEIYQSFLASVNASSVTSKLKICVQENFVVKLAIAHFKPFS